VEIKNRREKKRKKKKKKILELKQDKNT